jgi:hypothetical protein
MGISGNILEGINQEVLQGSRLRVFAAVAESGAAFTIHCLLALIAKHIHKHTP